MFSEPTFYLQRDEKVKQGFVYSIKNGDQLIGSIREMTSSREKVSNKLIQFLRIFTPYSANSTVVESLDLKLLDKENNRLGIITKGAGFDKDLYLRTGEGEHIATVKLTTQLKSASISVTDQDGVPLLNTTDSPFSLNFTITDCSTNEHIATIKKRSLIYESIRENFLKNDVYHVSNNSNKSKVTYALIGMALAVDLYMRG